MNCSVGKKAVAFGIFKFAHTPALTFTCSNGSYVFEIRDDHFANSKFTLGVIRTMFLEPEDYSFSKALPNYKYQQRKTVNLT